MRKRARNNDLQYKDWWCCDNSLSNNYGQFIVEQNELYTKCDRKKIQSYTIFEVRECFRHFAFSFLLVTVKFNLKCILLLYQHLNLYYWYISKIFKLYNFSSMFACIFIFLSTWTKKLKEFSGYNFFRATMNTSTNKLIFR